MNNLVFGYLNVITAQATLLSNPRGVMKGVRRITLDGAEISGHFLRPTGDASGTTPSWKWGESRRIAVTFSDEDLFLRLNLVYSPTS
jgi:hypothetical protein